MKAILVLNKMPVWCGECPLFNNEEHLCVMWLSDDSCYPNCPLKDMPSKMAVEDIDEHTDPMLVKMGYVSGWNDCLEEMLK